MNNTFHERSIMWKHWDLFFFLLVLALVRVEGLNTRPQIISRGTIYDATDGSVVTMSCDVENLAQGKVIWRFLNHNLTISVNEHIYTADTRQYSVLHHNGTSGWSLLLTSVSASDVGFYQCSIYNQPAQYITHTLTIQGVRMPDKPSYIPKANFTECCTRANVNTKCLSGCLPSTADFQNLSAISECRQDFSKIFKCSLDGRNHIPCCLRMRIPSQCMVFCSADFNITTLSPSQITQCMKRATDIGICIDEAQILIPSGPEQLTASALTWSSIFVTWVRPSSYFYKITGYRVFYGPTSTTNTDTILYNSTSVIGSGVGHEIVSGLDPNREYEIYVLAMSPHGVSSPSYHIRTFTKQKGQPVKPPPYSVQDCCKKQGVSSVCLNVLCGGDPTRLDPNAFFNCVEDFNRSLPCYAEGRDHSRCCRKKGLSWYCSQFCNGRPVTSINIQNLPCVYDMDDVSNCIMQGQVTIPGSPQNIRLMSVGDRTANVTWDPPTINLDKLAYYLVQFKQHNKYKVFASQTFSRHNKSAVLRYLRPNQLYDVRVVAGNPAGTSAPTATIVLLTYPTDGIRSGKVAPPRVKVPYNATACCENKRLPGECTAMCDYNVTVDKLKNNNKKCMNYAVDIVQCVSGGRNHRHCCRSKNVRVGCITLCDISPATNVSESQIGCISEQPEILSCMKEGVGKIDSSSECAGSNPDCYQFSGFSIELGFFLP